jgi:hypothetical protein
LRRTSAQAALAAVALPVGDVEIKPEPIVRADERAPALSGRTSGGGHGSRTGTNAQDRAGE